MQICGAQNSIGGPRPRAIEFVKCSTKKGSAHWGFVVNSVLNRTDCIKYIYYLYHCLEKSFCSQWVNTKLELNVF